MEKKKKQMTPPGKIPGQSLSFLFQYNQLGKSRDHFLKGIDPPPTHKRTAI